jgi:glyoxylase I family protein
MHEVPDSPAVLNHFGHCVTDLDRSVAFYCDLFGFVERRRMAVPDEPAAQLLGVGTPLGLTAAYLEKNGTTLELLSFNRPGNPPPRVRPFTEPGLTHMSFCVNDLAAACAQAEQLGGSVIDETDIGAAVFIRDPDGQPIELLPMAYRQMIE